MSSLLSADIELEERKFYSRILGTERSIWVQYLGLQATSLPLLLFLDGELYRNRVGAPEVLSQLRQAELIPACVAVYVSTHSVESRWLECPCHPPFAQFILSELLPWLRASLPVSPYASSTTLIGLSYTGLATAFVALHGSSDIGNVVCQSASFWSNDDCIINEYRRTDKLPLSFCVSVGLKETAENVLHKEDVLQVRSQLDVNRDMRGVLQEKGYKVSYTEFDGGHDPGCWREDLALGLKTQKFLSGVCD